MTQRATQGKLSRRAVHFETIDQALAEAERLADLEKSGAAIYVGNWTVGQILNHVAAWAEYSYVPCPLKVPWFVRWASRMLKSRFLNKGLSSGVKIPRVSGGTLAIERVSADEGLTRFRNAFARLKREAPTCPSPLFGMLTQEEATRLHLRHAELHFSFVVG